MLKLPSFEPRWLDLPHGVRINYRPATQSDIDAAAAWAKAEVERATAERKERLGLDADEDQKARISSGFMVLALARLCVIGWEGVEDECTPEAAAKLMLMQGMSDGFMGPVAASWRALDAEGNGSAPAPTGTTAGAPNTAEVAETAA